MLPVFRNFVNNVAQCWVFGAQNYNWDVKQLCLKTQSKFARKSASKTEYFKLLLKIIVNTQYGVWFKMETRLGGSQHRNGECDKFSDGANKLTTFTGDCQNRTTRENKTTQELQTPNAYGDAADWDLSRESGKEIFGSFDASAICSQKKILGEREKGGLQALIHGAWKVAAFLLRRLKAQWEEVRIWECDDDVARSRLQWTKANDGWFGLAEVFWSQTSSFSWCTNNGFDCSTFLDCDVHPVRRPAVEWRWDTV
jgi:hypothetical protein